MAQYMAITSMSASTGYDPAGGGPGLGRQKGGARLSLTSPRDHAVSPGAEPVPVLLGGAGISQTPTMGLFLGATDKKRSGAAGHVISGGTGATEGRQGKWQEEVQEAEGQCCASVFPTHSSS